MRLSQTAAGLTSALEKKLSATFVINPLTPNDTYGGRTAPLTSKVAFYIFIQQI